MYKHAVRSLYNNTIHSKIINKIAITEQQESELENLLTQVGQTNWPKLLKPDKEIEAAVEKIIKDIQTIARSATQISNTTIELKQSPYSVKEKLGRKGYRVKSGWHQEPKRIKEESIKPTKI